eukprot:3020159-Prymnesium_polylepis.1
MASLLLLSNFVVLTVIEFSPEKPQPESFDSYLFFERRTASLTHERWFKEGKLLELRPEAAELVNLYAFWGFVWACKIILSSVAFMPILYDAHNGIALTFSATALKASDPDNADTVAWEPAGIVSTLLLGIVWIVGVLAFVAETLLWYNIALAIFGGFSGLAMNGVGSELAMQSKIKRMRANGEKRLLPTSNRNRAAWPKLFGALLDELEERHHISADERQQLAAV